MRVRPIFWCILALACAGVLIFASTIQIHAPAIMQVHVDQATPASVGFTTIELHLSDTQGLPIEQAQVIPSARMTNMNMTTRAIFVRTRGEGNFSVQLQLYMAGPWEIDILA